MRTKKNLTCNGSVTALFVTISICESQNWLYLVCIRGGTVQLFHGSVCIMVLETFWHNFCVNVHLNNTSERAYICTHSEAWVCALLMSIRTNLTGRASSPPLALKCLNWQGLHEFSVNTDINVCCSDLTCLRELSAPGWWRNKWQLIIQHTALALNKSEWFVHFFFFHIAVVVMYWEARVLIHQQKHISRTLLL